MACKKLYIIPLFFLCLELMDVHAQDAILVTGGEASGKGGSVSYSIGQMVNVINLGANGSVAQGVQQPYEISVVTGFEETKKIILISSVYPNPATSYLHLKVENEKFKDINYVLYDINGKHLNKQKLLDNETTIDMSNLVHGTYFLRVSEKNKEVNTFKIIKKIN